MCLSYLPCFDKLVYSKCMVIKSMDLAFIEVFDSFFVFLTIFSFYGLAFTEDHDTLCLTLTMLCCSVDCESAFSFNSNYFKQSNQSREKCFRWFSGLVLCWKMLIQYFNKNSWRQQWYHCVSNVSILCISVVHILTLGVQINFKWCFRNDLEAWIKWTCIVTWYNPLQTFHSESFYFRFFAPLVTININLAALEYSQYKFHGRY